MGMAYRNVESLLHICLINREYVALQVQNLEICKSDDSSITRKRTIVSDREFLTIQPE